jgi:hypothetical protein
MLLDHIRLESLTKEKRTTFMMRRLVSGPFSCAALACLLVAATGCESEARHRPPRFVQKVASKEQSGFLSDYSRLKPDPRLDEAVLTYINQDQAKNLHGYVSVIVDPVQIYVATDADLSKISTPNATRAALYFQSALKAAVQDAFPLAEEPGPLVLRLRAAIVGVDVGGDVTSEDGAAHDKAVNIAKAIIELELVDSVTGEVIAAALDKEAAGEGEIGSGASREQRFHLAKVAMDTWAHRVREFLNAEHELSPEDSAKADASYKPYDEE